MKNGKGEPNEAIVPVTPAEILTNERQTLIKVEHLIVSPTPMERLQLGDVDSLETFARNNRSLITGIMWDEEAISFIMSNNQVVKFVPEWHAATRMFFAREGLRARRDQGDHIWEGEYQPVVMNKTILVKYLKAHAEYFTDEVVKAVKATRVTESRVSSHISLSEVDEDNARTEEEYVKETNIPPILEATMPLLYGPGGGEYFADLRFEVSLVKDKDYNDRPKGNWKIQLRLLNGREAVRGVMQVIVSKVDLSHGGIINSPATIPSYYGKYSLEIGKS